MSGYFITGTDTEVGKTVVAAIIAKATQAAYWKPIQCGNLNLTDSDRVSHLVPKAKIYPETYRFALAASPHAAAAAENMRVDLALLEGPGPKESPVIVEGAGGVMVPLNAQHLMLDLMVKLALPVILVSRTYLGSINHTLLSIAALKSRGLAVTGVIFTGETNQTTEDAITCLSHVRILGRIPWTEHIDGIFTAEQAKEEWLHDLM